MSQPTRLSTIFCISLLAFTCLTTACVTQQRGSQAAGPELKASSTSLVYASRVPEQLSALMTRAQENEKELQANWEAFAKYPAAYNDKKAKWDSVSRVLKTADEAGRSQSYATAMRERNTISRFADQHAGAMAWRVGGNVNAVLKKNACSYDAGGAVRFGINDAFERQMNEHVKSSNEAYNVLDKEGDNVGKGNVKTLEDQIPVISRTSFLVYIEMEDIRSEVKRLMDEQSDVRETLQAARNEELELANSREEKRSKPMRNAAAKRAETYTAKIESLDKDTKTAQEWLKRMEEGLSTMRSTHSEKVGAMVDAVESKE